MKKIIAYFVMIIISSIIFVGCSNSDQAKLKEKTYTEVLYIEDNVDILLRSLLIKKSESSIKDENKQSQESGKEIEEGKKYEINWNEANKIIETIYSTWGDLAVNLNQLGIADDEILAFGNEINNVKLSINLKQENLLIKSLSNIYSFIPKYLVICSDDSFEIIKMNIKYNIINSACTAKNEDWGETDRYLNIAESEYIELMSNEEYVKRNQYNLNRVYIFLEELKKTVELKNFEIFLLKYEVLLNEL